MAGRDAVRPEFFAGLYWMKKSIIKNSHKNIVSLKRRKK